MPPRKRVGAGARRGKWAGTPYERPLDAAPAYPGVPTPAESKWDGTVSGHAKSRNVLSYHTHDSRRSQPGFPDWAFVGDRGFMLRELKVLPHGVVSDDQAEWMDRLRAVGIDVDVWWFPRDWNSGRVQNEINALGRRGPHSPDLTSEIGQLLFLATVPPAEVPGAALQWDAGNRVNREWWRKEALLILHRAASYLPVTADELTDWLRDHRLPADASPAAVLAAVRQTFLRHENGAK